MDNSKSTAAMSQASDGGQVVWDEARIEEAMQRLKLLHIKARLLRDAIPRMINPLVQKHPTHAMVNAFMKSVNDVQNEIKEYSELIKDATSKEVFARAVESETARPNGIKPWSHSDDPNWFNMDAK